MANKKIDYMQRGTCTVEACPYDARARTPYCANCSSAFSRWEKKGAAAILERKARLDCWANRMIYLGETKNKKEYGNVARKLKR